MRRKAPRGWFGKGAFCIVAVVAGVGTTAGSKVQYLLRTRHGDQLALVLCWRRTARQRYTRPSILCLPRRVPSFFFSFPLYFSFEQKKTRSIAQDLQKRRGCSEADETRMLKQKVFFFAFA
jgi:hypothetical protein